MTCYLSLEDCRIVGQTYPRTSIIFQLKCGNYVELLAASYNPRPADSKKVEKLIVSDYVGE